MSNYPKLDHIREKEGIAKNNTNFKKGFLIFGKIALVFFIVIAISGALFSYKMIASGKSITLDGSQGSIFQQLKRLVISGDKYLKGEGEGRTNILLLGMGGEGHQGALLTDTIIIVSINHHHDTDKKDVSMISIPRDLYVPLENDDFYRINSIYALGAARNSEEGTELISDTINKIAGIDIHYHVIVNFDGFQEIVDSLDGVDVYVERSFYDSEYPTDDFGYQTVVFKKGMNHMNGDQALKYARSRHGVVVDEEGTEASDFARARRQQILLTSIRDKALSIETIMNPKKITDTLSALGNNVQTDLEIWEMVRLAELGQEINQEEIINKVIDHGKNNFLYSTIAPSGAYVLLPKKKDYSEIRNFVTNIFDTQYIKSENAKVEVLNATGNEGLAQEMANQLSFEDYNIVSIGNATGIDSAQEKTVIYNLNDNKKDITLARLKEKFDNCEIRNINNRYDIVDPETTEELNVDVIVVLGQDSVFTN